MVVVEPGRVELPLLGQQQRTRGSGSHISWTSSSARLSPLRSHWLPVQPEDRQRQQDQHGGMRAPHSSGRVAEPLQQVRGPGGHQQGTGKKGHHVVGFLVLVDLVGQG